MRARPRKTVELASEPPGAEIEVNGQLAGRTPARVALPQGRCFLSVTRAGYKPHLAACPSSRDTVVALQPATKDGLRDQLRDCIASDVAWFLEPVLADMLATVEDARWIVVLERDKGRGLKALVFSAAEHALKPIEPSRFIDSELDKLSAAVRALVLRGQRLDASAIDTPSGIPALEARAADPALASAAAFVRRAGGSDFLRLSMSSLGGGWFMAGCRRCSPKTARGTSNITSRAATPRARSRAWRATPRRRCAFAGRWGLRRGARAPVTLVPVAGAGRRGRRRRRDRRLLRHALRRHLRQAGARP